MKVKYLLILLGIVICTVSFRWFEVLQHSNANDTDKQEQQSDSGIPTPDQLWEQQQKRSIDHTPKAASTLVSQRLLELEAKAKEQATWEGGFVDENDIPPADPDRPYIEDSQQIISATEPELDVLPSELIDAERQLLAKQEKMEIIVPMTIDSVDLLQPEEIPAEPAEIEALPEELMSLEYAAGSQL